MPSSSIVHLNSLVSVLHTPSKKFFVRQNPDLSGKAHSIFRLSYGLAALVLGLASSSVAHAAALLSEDRGETDAIGLVKTEMTKTPKSEPSNFSALIAEGLEDPQIQQPTLNSLLWVHLNQVHVENRSSAPHPQPLSQGARGAGEPFKVPLPSGEGFRV
jgi:hypothetical protein